MTKRDFEAMVKRVREGDWTGDILGDGHTSGVVDIVRREVDRAVRAERAKMCPVCRAWSRGERTGCHEDHRPRHPGGGGAAEVRE